MKRTALAIMLILIFALTPITKAKAVQFDYSQFEGLPYDPPVLTLTSPSSNATYIVAHVPINVTVQIQGWIYGNMEQMRWLNYSLDGAPANPTTLIVPSLHEVRQLPYSAYGNHMLEGLSDGAHNLTIYGETFIGGLNCYFNETVSFRVNTSSMPTTEPFPTALLIATSVIVAVVCIVSVVYIKKRKQNTHENSS